MPSYPEPTWGEPYRVCQPVLSDRTPRTPSVVSAGILSMLRNHFGSSERIMDRRISDHTWHPDPKICRLTVEPAMTYEPVITGNSPALVVQPGNLRIENVTLGDRFTPYKEPNGIIKGKGKIVNFGGEIKVLALAPLPLQALVLMEEAALSVILYADEYADSLSLSSLFLSGMDPPTTRDQEQGGSVREYIASVTIRWHAIQDWVVSTRGPVFRRGGLSL